MAVLKAVLLGLVQGLTEFLPISSSGHLVLFQELLGFGLPGVTFEIFVHVGTLLAVLLSYYQDVVLLIREFLLRGFEVITGAASGAEFWRNPHSRLAVLLVVGSIPAAVVGLTLQKAVESLFDSLLWVGVFWLCTSFLLWLLQLLPERRLTRSSMGTIAALIIGLFQAAAIAPGISRSGATIVGGVLSGLSREEAANFSFLLSMPAIMGALLVDLWNQPVLETTLPWNTLAAGACAAALSGYIAIKWLLALLRRGQLSGFALYTLLLGLGTIANQVL